MQCYLNQIEKKIRYLSYKNTWTWSVIWPVSITSAQKTLWSDIFPGFPVISLLCFIFFCVLLQSVNDTNKRPNIPALSSVVLPKRRRPLPHLYSACSGLDQDEWSLFADSQLRRRTSEQMKDVKDGKCCVLNSISRMSCTQIYETISADKTAIHFENYF